MFPIRSLPFSDCDITAFVIMQYVAGIDGKRNQTASVEARLRRKLFHANYDPELRPVVNRSDKVTIKLGLSLHQIINVVRRLNLL